MISEKRDLRCNTTNHFLHFRLNVRLCFRQANDFLAVLPLGALLQEFDALEAFQDVALGRNSAGSL